MPANNKKRIIVTACDEGYFWGAFLLVASLKRFNVDCDINILGFDLSPESSSLLTQFDRVKVIPADKDMAFNGKIGALRTANQGMISWLDADCMVTGDVTQYIEVPKNGIRIRFRSPEENGLRFAAEYSSEDEYGSVPDFLLKHWKEDVNEKTEPATSSVASNCAFTLDSSKLDFIDKWHDFMKMIRNENKQSPAYSLGLSGKRMSDELAINALLAFSKSAPDTYPYLLDQDKDAYLVHFHERRKPWNMWTLSQIKHYDLVMETIDWVEKSNFQLPASRPWPFQKSKKPLAFTFAYLLQFMSSIKAQIKKIVR